MTFRDWQSLEPAEAAREIHRRFRTLPPTQQRAVIAHLVPEQDLADAFARSNSSAPLSRVPYFLKDLFDVANLPTFAGSTFLPEVRPTPPRNSHLVDALQTGGAVFAGKTHLHEFAYGITGENPHYGDCEHPRLPGRTTGGSSSGSAAAVAAGIVPLAIGTDTGGSVRVPSAFCGLFGFRLTPGDPFIADAVSLSHSCDTAGWFTADTRDLRETIAALIGLSPAPAQTPRGCFLELPGLDPEVALAFQAAASDFAPPADATTRDILLAGFAPTLDAYNTIVAHEAWQTHHTWFDRFRDRYDPFVQQRLVRASTLPADQIQSAYDRRTATSELWQSYFTAFDFLILPATPFPALTKPDCTFENRQRLLTLTAPASLGGLPVLTFPILLPSGFTTGLQLILPHPRSPVIPWSLSR